MSAEKRGSLLGSLIRGGGQKKATPASGSGSHEEKPASLDTIGTPAVVKPADEGSTVREKRERKVKKSWAVKRVNTMAVGDLAWLWNLSESEVVDRALDAYVQAHLQELEKATELRKQADVRVAS